MPRGATRKKILLQSLPEQCFWVHEGPIISDLRELKEALKNDISPAQFSHHVHGEQNDFADWVEKVLDDPKCAKALRSVKKQTTMQEKIASCLKSYKK